MIRDAVRPPLVDPDLVSPEPDIPDIVSPEPVISDFIRLDARTRSETYSATFCTITSTPHGTLDWQTPLGRHKVVQIHFLTKNGPLEVIEDQILKKNYGPKSAD